MALRNPYNFEEDSTLKSGFDMEVVTRPAQLSSNYIFECGVCFGLPRMPVSLGCRHVICDKCAQRLSPRRCPVCRHVFAHTQWLVEIEEAWRDYKRYRVKCAFRYGQCGFEGNPVEVNNHQDECVNHPWYVSHCGHHVADRDTRLHDQYHEWERGMHCKNII